jgi:hypothetical protein
MSSDGNYRQLLRELSAEPGQAVDWAELYARLEHAAEVPLARRRETWGTVPIRRREMAWWEVAARGRVTIPLALAASLAMAVYIGLHPVDSSSGSPSDARDAFEAMVTGATSSQQVVSLLVTSAADVYSPASGTGGDSQ